MTWRYQPVYVEHDGERIYSLCEVYLDACDELEFWTESVAIAPGGDDMDEMIGDIGNMLNDAKNWVPVSFADLRPGLRFESKAR